MKDMLRGETFTSALEQILLLEGSASGTQITRS
jgi:hypothetical protein